MKLQNFLGALSVLTFCLAGDLNTKAGDIPLEQLLGTYIPPAVWLDTDIKTLTLKVQANRLLCVDSKTNTFNATYKDQVLFIDFDRGLLKLDGRSLPKSGLYLSIRWGERIYLIHKNDIPGFCDAINAGIEPHASWYRYKYYFKGDRDKEVTGDPELPAAYKSLLLSKPISGKVVELAERGTAWVDLGSDAGVRPGMTLMNHWLPDQFPKIKNIPGMIEPRTDLITVLKVEKARCLVEGGIFEIGSPITARHWD